MFCTPTIVLTARVRHQCTNCCQDINPGEKYARWYSVDDSGFTNKMHPECLEALREDAQYGYFEYTAYGGERPEVDA